MDFSSRLLEQFVVLAEEKHFGRAAERLSMSQPPLSQAMRRLERGIGVELLARSTREVRLTAAGKAFAEDARRLLESQAGAVERARRIAKGLEGELRIGYVPGLGYWFVPRLVGFAAEELPGLRVQLRQGRSSALLDEVRSGAVDVAFIRRPPRKAEEADGIEVRLCAEERLCVDVPPGHRLAGAKSVRLAELADEEFVLPSPRTLPELYHQVVGACQRAGFMPRIRVHADDLLGIVSYTAAGLGISFVPEPAAVLGHGMVLTIALEEDAGVGAAPVFSVHRREPDVAVARLLDLVRRRREEFEWRGVREGGPETPDPSLGNV
ncbi:MAG: LysR family transcriptional regulator [Segniliparus sp.]|uniref:LysR family transcriptional regulator n=1 Tax=Segniliparus sp. TaxID=2804064 RepID=UPI003F31241A